MRRFLESDELVQVTALAVLTSIRGCAPTWDQQGWRWDKLLAVGVSDS